MPFATRAGEKKGLHTLWVEYGYKIGFRGKQDPRLVHGHNRQSERDSMKRRKFRFQTEF